MINKKDSKTKKNRMSLLDLKPSSWGEGTEKISEQIDDVKDIEVISS